jgi:hypothetical protein
LSSIRYGSPTSATTEEASSMSTQIACTYRLCLRRCILARHDDRRT